MCDKNYAGDNCELTYVQSTWLRGDVLLFLVGQKEKVVRHLNEILSGIGNVLRVSIRVHLDEHDRPVS